MKSSGKSRGLERCGTALVTPFDDKGPHRLRRYRGAGRVADRRRASTFSSLRHDRRVADAVPRRAQGGHGGGRARRQRARAGHRGRGRQPHGAGGLLGARRGRGAGRRHRLGHPDVQPAEPRRAACGTSRPSPRRRTCRSDRLQRRPRARGLDLDVETILRLAEIPNVAGLMEASSDFGKIAQADGELCRGTSPCILGARHDRSALIALGARGVISVAANEIPKEMSDARAGGPGRPPRARRWSSRASTSR